MGNAESCNALQTKLDELEDTLHVLAVTNPVGCRPLLPHQILLHGIVVTCKKGVRVNVGPVVGIVGADYARILLEVNMTTTITCHVARQEKITGQMMEVDRIRINMECMKNRPCIFHLRELKPNTRYHYVFSGLSHEDAISRNGSFYTSHRCDLPTYIGIVSGNDIFHGETKQWNEIANRLTSNEDISIHEPIHYMIHLGGQISLKRTLEQCWIHLHRYAQRTESKISWEEMEENTIERMRAAYRYQWTLPSLRTVLANTSNMMIWSDQDIYDNFTVSSKFQFAHDAPTSEMQIMRILLRSARYVYHEYQRQLWDVNYKSFQGMQSELRHASERSIQVSNQIELNSIEINEINKNLIHLKKKMEFEKIKQVEKRRNEVENESKEHEITFLKLNQDTKPLRGEEYYFKTENGISFLMLDIRGSKLSPGGIQMNDNPIFTPTQWDFILDSLNDIDTRLLVVSSELPLIDETHSNIMTMLDGESTIACHSWWGYIPNDQQRLLTLLSEWKLQKPNRDILVLAGASSLKFPLRSIVKDIKLRTEFQQYVVGPIAGKLDALRLPSMNGFLGDGLRFEYQHQLELLKEKNFATASLTAYQGRDPVYDVKYHGEIQSDVQVLLGPIMGLVDSQSCVILLEIDQEATVGCILTNALTSEEHRLVQVLPARRPKQFYFTHLTSEQPYHVQFQGLADKSISCSFQTLSNKPTQLKLVLVCRDVLEPFGMSRESHHSWKSIEQNISQPFSTVNLIVHLGGQVQAHGNGITEEAITLLKARDVSDPTTLEAVKDHLREIYRSHWNLPDKRNVLSCGSHLMLWNEIDTMDSFQIDHDRHMNVLSLLLEEIACEYQNQLWLPHSVHRHRFGPFGFYAWRKQNSNAVDTRWKSLKNLLDQPITTLIIACDHPLIDDSIEDTRLKAKFNSIYTQRIPYNGKDLLQLIEMIFEWKGLSNKQVVCICGNDHFGFDTLIQHAMNGMTIRQFVVGPLLNRLSMDMLRAITYLPQGSIGHLCTYSHNYEETYLTRHFGVLTIGEITIRYDIIHENDFDGKESIGDQCFPIHSSQWCESNNIPEWFRYVLDGKLSDEMESTIKRIQSIIETKDSELIESYSYAKEPAKFTRNCMDLTNRLHSAIERFYDTCGLEMKAKMKIPSILALYTVVNEMAVNGMIDINIYRQICKSSFQMEIRIENAIQLTRKDKMTKLS